MQSPCNHKKNRSTHRFKLEQVATASVLPKNFISAIHRASLSPKKRFGATFSCFTAILKQTVSVNYISGFLRAYQQIIVCSTDVMLALPMSDHSKSFFAPIFFSAKSLDSFFVGRNNMGLMVYLPACRGQCTPMCSFD